jgi:hypothetical protein
MNVDAQSLFVLFALLRNLTHMSREILAHMGENDPFGAECLFIRCKL